MMSSTRRSFLILAVAALALLVACFFATPFGRWLLVGLYALSLTIWVRLAVVAHLNRIRFGAAMSFEEIIREKDPRRMVQLIRYHLGWSAGKIATELNRLGVMNHGLPWSEDDVRQAVKSVGRSF